MEIIITVWGLIQQLMIIVPSIIAGNAIITGLVNGAFNVQKKWVMHLISWVLAVIIGIITVLSGGFNIFASSTANIIFGAAAGLVAGGASNGLYDWDAISNIINQFYTLFGHKTPTEVKAEAKRAEIEALVQQELAARKQ